jgi:hypothetical protein
VNERVRTAQAPARTLYVQAAPGATLPALDDAPQQAADTTADPTMQSDVEPRLSTNAEGGAAWGWALLFALTTLVCAAGWAVTWWRTRRTVQPHEVPPPNRQAAEKLAFADLRRAASTGDPAKVRGALTTWMRRRAAIANDPMTDARLRSLVGELDAALYGPTPRVNRGGIDALLERIVELRNARAPEEDDGALPSLYLTPRAPS